MSDESLLTSVVPRTLETKNKILGLELMDILVLLLNVSIQNLIFGSTAMKVPMVFGTSALFAAAMFFFKRGKPDGYIQHYSEYLITPTVLTANSHDRLYRRFTGKVAA